MIIDFLEQCITLHNHNIYHSDIKPINICVNSNNVSNIKSEQIIIHRLKLIDYGITYSEFEYIHNKPYDTTISSASPEYLKIQLYDKNNSFPKELFDYSEHYAIAGIILGVFLNKPSFLFSISCKLMLKHADVTSYEYFDKDGYNRWEPAHSISCPLSPTDQELVNSK
jgi:serine/threonine protein kinase